MTQGTTDHRLLPPWPGSVAEKLAAVHESGYSSAYVAALEARLRYARATLHRIACDPEPWDREEMIDAAFEAYTNIGEIPR